MRNMPFKNIILFFFLLISVLTLGCETGNAQSPAIYSPGTIFPTETNASQSNIPEPTQAPLQLNLLLSKAPKLGETAELTYKLIIRDIEKFGSGLANSKAWIDFEWTNIHGSYSEAKSTLPIPSSEVLVNGDSSWQGNALEKRNDKIFNCEIQLPREGIWKIKAYFQPEGSAYPESADTQVAVADGTADIISSPEFSRGPLAYLGNFIYGNGNDPRLDSSQPVILVTDISKAPKVGEEANLTCHITSLYDINDFLAKITISKWKKGTTGTVISETDLLVKGDLVWRGSLKAMNPIDMVATIKFPEAGDWKIHYDGNTPNYGNTPKIDIRYANEIRMTVTPIRGSFGWQNYPEQLMYR
jgi:hypothetical protein